MLRHGACCWETHSFGVTNTHICTYSLCGGSTQQWYELSNADVLLEKLSAKNAICTLIQDKIGAETLVLNRIILCHHVEFLHFFQNEVFYLEYGSVVQ